MIGKIHRVTYNVVKHVAELHMSDEEWNTMVHGNVIQNFNDLLESFEKECEKEMENGPYLLDPSTGEKTYLNKNEE